MFFDTAADLFTNLFIVWAPFLIPFFLVSIGILIGHTLRSSK